MSAIPESFNAFRIRNDAEGYRSGIESTSLEDLSEGEVVIRSSWSGINYKDALAGTGKGKSKSEARHSGVGRNLDTVTYAGYRFVCLEEVLCDFHQVFVIANVFRGASARNEQAVVIGRIDLEEHRACFYEVAWSTVF